ncbi:MAG TPA: efflux RND transporter periplasmic adaptor subunit, partial [archaeon]|nr:efflux RND transporter periplasmic adaptor subunit [archaeon]
MTKNEILKYPLLTLFSLTLALAGCQKSEAQDPGQVTARPVKLTNVEVQTVHSTELEEYLTLTGHTEAAHDIIISSEQGGTVLELLFDRGDRVTAGQVLCRVSDDIYKAQLAEAEANLRLKEAGLKKAAALYERGSITAMNRLQAQVEYDAAAANVEIAKSRLDRAVIKAPISGKIEDRFIDIGEMVPPGGRLFRLADRRKIKIKSEFAELDVSTFKPGIAAEVHFDALPDTVFTARLVFVSSSAHEASRTFPCEFELDNLREMIRGGMIARI